MHDATPERHLDMFLGKRAPTEPTRDDVLAALRDHLGYSVIVQYERDDEGYSVELHLAGRLLTAWREPGASEEEWEAAELTAEEFVMLADTDAQLWDRDAPNVEPVGRVPDIPDDREIIEYLGNGGCTGYRWPFGPGLTVTVVLWHELLTLTETGEVAPEMPEVRVELPEQD
jgi:hypothetical protein